MRLATNPFGYFPFPVFARLPGIAVIRRLKMAENFDDPKDIVPAALEFLSLAEFGRMDGKCIWKGKKWKYCIYKINEPAGTIRIDLRKIVK